MIGLIAFVGVVIIGCDVGVVDVGVGVGDWIHPSSCKSNMYCNVFWWENLVCQITAE